MKNPKDINVLVACEESQVVCIAFRKLGFNAFSCDLLPCSGVHPEWHIIGDAIFVLNSRKWDLVIAHPPCTYMSRAGARWMFPTAGNLSKDRYFKAMEAKEFFMNFLNANILFIAVENPLPLKVIELPKETQVIQPFEYGHEFSKRTHLWLKGLPNLTPTNIKENHVPYLPSNTGGVKRGQKATIKRITQKESSKTFTGIANAMAEQWGKYLLETI